MLTLVKYGSIIKIVDVINISTNKNAWRGHSKRFAVSYKLQLYGEVT